MSDRKKKLGAYDKEFVWHPFTQMREYEEKEPVIIEGGEGAYLIDSEGGRYIDGVSSLWVNVHGHRVPEIDNAIKNQVEKLGHSTLLGITNPPAAELAKELIDICPPGTEKGVLFGRRRECRRGSAQNGISILAARWQAR